MATESTKQSDAGSAGPSGAGTVAPSASTSFSFYDASFNYIWKRMGPDVDKKLATFKKKLYSQVTGNILEIGSGHGATFPYFDAEKISHITCLEPNPAMHELLRENAKKAGFEEDKGNLTLICLPAEAASPSWYSPTNEDPEVTPHYDNIVSSLVLCTVADEDQVLRNVHDWLRPSGKFYFLEHAGSGVETWRRFFQAWMTPVWKYIGHGCHLDRDHIDIMKNIAGESGKLWDPVEVEEIDPEEKVVDGMWIARPLIMGTAVRA